MQASILLEYIIEALVTKKDEIKIEEIPGPEESVLEVRVADSDVGKVIGKNGSVARSLRQVLLAAGTKDKKNYVLEIID
ncbi:MAG TPA: KH domain-containing protein [Leptospiraceae bacterium]|nr:KH domain-containing protein [Leptospiraceae bacterium]HMW59695.1 KH domain-containing protein [Leptospiraceae bacterium]HMX57958.1 KH domain-containing protein [Leptospiraceae bacterium]HMY46833.1 KH domain-containing protein [Leptospiraceae bacterium]HMZ35685.1 KH domain-containing protein [Leptospiraceae bacterium]